jgi:hypothetical protein
MMFPPFGTYEGVEKALLIVSLGSPRAFEILRRPGQAGTPQNDQGFNEA